MKKLLPLLLTLALLLGIGAPVYAADGGSSEAGLREEAIVKTLEALDEPLYKDTYAALLNGESIRKGSHGEAARGVQQTLVDFGQSIGVDGSVGSRCWSACGCTGTRRRGKRCPTRRTAGLSIWRAAPGRCAGNTSRRRSASA